VDAANDNGLMHALERHTKQKEPRDFDITRKVNEYLAQCSYLLKEVLLPFYLLFWWWNSQSSCFLQVFNSIADVSVFWRLDGTAKDLFGCVVSPKLNLKNELFERTSLHFWLGILWNTILKERFRAHSKHKTILHSTGTT